MKLSLVIFSFALSLTTFAEPVFCPQPLQGDFLFQVKNYSQLNWDKLDGLRFKGNRAVVGLKKSGAALLESNDLFETRIDCYKDGGRWNASLRTKNESLPVEIFVGVDGARILIKIDGRQEWLNELHRP